MLPHTRILHMPWPEVQPQPCAQQRCVKPLHYPGLQLRYLLVGTTVLCKWWQEAEQQHDSTTILWTSRHKMPWKRNSYLDWRMFFIGSIYRELLLTVCHYSSQGLFHKERTEPNFKLRPFPRGWFTNAIFELCLILFQNVWCKQSFKAFRCSSKLVQIIWRKTYIEKTEFLALYHYAPCCILTEPNSN